MMQCSGARRTTTPPRVCSPHCASIVSTMHSVKRANSRAHAPNARGVLRNGCLRGSRSLGTEPPDLLRCRPLLALDDVEFNGFALGERLVALALDRGMMDEAVRLTVRPADEAESLRVVEPFDRT